MPSGLPTPRYLLRTSLAMSAIRELDASTFLEVGCGTGDFARRLGMKGLRGVAFEPAPEARAAAERQLGDLDVSVVGALEGLPRDYELLVALEVLEHLPDDVGELRGWLEYVAPGGHLVASVPAHMSMWSAADEAVGHVRRYSRDGLRHLAQAAGLEVKDIRSVGFPLTSITRPIRHWLYRHDDSVRPLDAMARTKASSHESFVDEGAGPFRRGLFAAAVAPFDLAQRAFTKTDLGDGFVLVAVKR